MNETLQKNINELQKDIEYFSNLGFVELSKKFSRDLKIIEDLQKLFDQNIKENPDGQVNC